MSENAGSSALLFDAHFIADTARTLDAAGDFDGAVECESFSVLKVKILHATFLQFTTFLCALAHVGSRLYERIVTAWVKRNAAYEMTSGYKTFTSWVRQRTDCAGGRKIIAAWRDDSGEPRIQCGKSSKQEIE